MKTSYLLFLFLLSYLGIFAQESKGITPIITGAGVGSGQLRAVVVGISDYQSSQITDLHYADKDAEAFASFLQSRAGGALDSDHLKVLIDSNATMARFAVALDWLLEVTKEGDEAIIYFSGHGDVEKKTLTQPGYLLCWDAPSKVYMAGGAFKLDNLKEIIQTLSIQNKAKVVIITDACRAGKLAGSTVGGAQATAANLSIQFANEVKILSCQANEFSLEGTQWGGGHGAFSFHLLDGLTGLADQNHDGTVNLLEIGHYLEEKVPAETAPQSQIPLCIGDRLFSITRVDASALAALQKAKAAKPSVFEEIGSKGIVEEILAHCDSLTRSRYAAFEAAMAQKNLLDGAPVANDLYIQLIQIEQLRPLYSLMRRNFAAALIDEVQQALNALLDNDPYEADKWNYNPARYRQFPDYLERAMELLGEQHYMYGSLMAKKLFFEGYNLARNLMEREKQSLVRDSLQATAKAKYLESLAIEPDAAYPYYMLGKLDSILVWMQKAVDRSPSWMLPYLDVAEHFNNDLYDLPNAEQWLLKAKVYHPESYLLLIRLAWLYQWKNDPDASNAICRELITLRPDLADAWATLSVTQYRMQNDWVEAKRSAQNALNINPNNLFGRTNHYAALIQTNPDSAVIYGLKLWREDPLDPVNYWIMVAMTAALVKLNRITEAEEWVEKLQQDSPKDPYFKIELQSRLGELRLMQGRPFEAEAAFKKSLDINSLEANQIKILALIGVAKEQQHSPGEAEVYFKRALELPFAWDQNQSKNEAYFQYGRFLLHQNRPAEAQIQFDNALKISPKTWHYPFGMALLAAKDKRTNQALDWLEKALRSYYFDETGIREEVLFAKIRKTKRFKELMLKNFPTFKEPKKR